MNVFNNAPLCTPEGKADLATAADTPMMFALMGGRKITTLAVIQTTDRNEAIVACL